MITYRLKKDVKGIPAGTRSKEVIMKQDGNYAVFEKGSIELLILITDDSEELEVINDSQNKGLSNTWF